MEACGRFADMQALGRRPSSIKPGEDASKRAGPQAQPAYEVSGPGLALCAPGVPTHFSVCSTTGARLKARPSSTQLLPEHGKPAVPALDGTTAEVGLGDCTSVARSPCKARKENRATLGCMFSTQAHVCHKGER